MKQVNSEVSVTVKDAISGADKTESSQVSYSEFENAEDVLTFLSGADKDATADFLGSLNYGVNLKARASVRATLLAKLEGPDKAINKAVEQFIKARAAMNKPVDEATARKIVTAMLGENAA